MFKIIIIPNKYSAHKAELITSPKTKTLQSSPLRATCTIHPRLKHRVTSAQINLPYVVHLSYFTMVFVHK